MGINPASLGYVYPQQQGSNTTSRVATGVKAGLFAAGTAGAVTYFGDFKGLTPVDANGNLFTEGLHVLEDKTLIQKGIDEASFGAQKTFLQGKGIAVDSAKDYAALSEYVKTGKIAEGASAAQKDIFARVLADSSSTIHSDLNALVRDTAGKNFETEVLPNINKFLQKHGLAEVKDKAAYNNLMSALHSHSGEAYTDALKEALAKDYKSVIDGANIAGKNSAFQSAAGLIKDASGNVDLSKCNFDVAKSYLRSLERSESYWKSLPETQDGILKFLKEKACNKAKLDSLKGAELSAFETKLNTAAQKLFELRNANLNGGSFTSISGKTRTITKISDKIAAQKGLVEGLQGDLQTKFGTYFDKARGILKEGAPKELAQYFKNFKWAKAGKYALIAGAVAAIGGLLFGGNKA